MNWPRGKVCKMISYCCCYCYCYCLQNDLLLLCNKKIHGQCGEGLQKLSKLISTLQLAKVAPGVTRQVYELETHPIPNHRMDTLWAVGVQKV